MNKLLIVLLGVCLFSVISAHSFVKRDTTTIADDVTAKLNALKDQLTDIAKNFNMTIDTEEIKKNTINFIDIATNAINNITSAVTAPAAGDAKPAAQ